MLSRALDYRPGTFSPVFVKASSSFTRRCRKNDIHTREMKTTDLAIVPFCPDQMDPKMDACKKKHPAKSGARAPDDKASLVR